MFWRKKPEPAIPPDVLDYLRTINWRVYQMALSFTNLVDAVGILASKVAAVEAKINAVKPDPAVEAANQKTADDLAAQVVAVNAKFDALLTDPAPPAA